MRNKLFDILSNFKILSEFSEHQISFEGISIYKCSTLSCDYYFRLLYSKSCNGNFYYSFTVYEYYSRNCNIKKEFSVSHGSFVVLCQEIEKILLLLGFEKKESKKC